MSRVHQLTTLSLGIIVSIGALPDSGWAAPPAARGFRAALPARPAPANLNPNANLKTNILLPNGIIVPVNAAALQAPNGAISRNFQFLLPNGTVINKQFNATPLGANGQATANRLVNVLLPNGQMAQFNATAASAANGAINRNSQLQLPNGTVINKQFNRTAPQGANGQVTANLNTNVQLPNGQMAQFNATSSRAANGAANHNTRLQLPDGTIINKQFNTTAPQGANGQVTTTSQVQVTANPNSPSFFPVGLGPFNGAFSPFMLTSNPYGSLALSRGITGTGYSSNGGYSPAMAYSPAMGYGAGMGQGYYGNQSRNYSNSQDQSYSQVPAQANTAANGESSVKGQSEWPLALRILPPGPTTKELRQEIEGLVKRAQQQSARTGQVQPQLIGKANRDIDKLRKLLDERAPDLPVSDYTITESRRFLNRLKDLIKSM